MKTSLKLAAAALILMCTATTASAQQPSRSFSSTSTSSSSSFQQLPDGTIAFEFQQTPLIDVLKTIAPASVAELNADATVGDKLTAPVSCVAESTTVQAAASSLLQNAGLRVTKLEEQLILTATETDEEITGDVVSLADLMMGQALAQPVSLNLRQSSLGTAARMASGRAGIDIEIDRVALQRAGINQRTLRVTMVCRDQPLGEVLADIADRHQLAIEIVGDSVIITTPEALEQSAELR
ncbi:MAG: hypothetical protein AAF456_03405 [Planctomycetota bacterium]